ncbi:MAG TPA: anti-sigma factor [Polyangiales bacterium]|jgi:anti-sigma factor RsiW|nr:anti-sigma factor [Polyangiales bacterium]
MKQNTVAGLQCSEVLALLSDYLDHELDSAMVDRVESHLLGCPSCERFGKSFGSMMVSLRRDAHASESVDSELVSRLLTRIDRLNTGV